MSPRNCKSLFNNKKRPDVVPLSQDFDSTSKSICKACLIALCMITLFTVCLAVGYGAFVVLFWLFP